MRAPTRKPCDREPDLWFSSDPADQYEAAQACSFCPFAISCQKFGDGEVHGVWGGRLKGYTKTRRQPTTKVCAYEECGNEFVTATASAKYCTPKCRDLAEVARRRAVYAAQSRCAFEPCRKRFTRKMKSQRFCSPKCGQLNKRATAKEAARQIQGNEHLRELLDAVAS